MLFTWILFYIVLFISSFIWIKPWWKALLFFSIIILCTQLVIYKMSFFYYPLNVPVQTIEQMYNTLQHGDIINMTRYREDEKWGSVYFFSLLSYRMAHCSLIIEENGIKYVVEGSRDKNLPNRIMSTSHPIPYQFGQEWYILKTPLLEYITVYPSSLYRILRPPPQYKMDYKIDYTFDPTAKSFYCTQFIGDVLYKNGIIPASSKMARYFPIELIESLINKGYTSTLVVTPS